MLLSALGPLVVYSAVLDVYSRNPQTVFSREERLDSLDQSGLPAALTESLWAGLHGHA